VNRQTDARYNIISLAEVTMITMVGKTHTNTLILYAGIIRKYR